MKPAELTGLALEYWFLKAVASGDIDGVSEQEFTEVGGIGLGWSEIGPVIERENISVEWHEKSRIWIAEYCEHGARERGDTPLIAVMRCIVAGKLGNDVDIPANQV